MSRLVVFDVLGHPKDVPVIPHYFSIDIALDITVMADIDSILGCQKCSESLLSSCSI